MGLSGFVGFLRGAYLCGGAITDFYGMYIVVNFLLEH